MEYIIYCDESVSDGKYYTDFFGGVLVRNTDYDIIREALGAGGVRCLILGVCGQCPNALPRVPQKRTVFQHYFVNL